jgi:toxin ParE1/3/4
VRIRVSPQGRADLDSIWLYLARESGNTDIATRTVGSIADKFGLLAKFPHIGKGLESEMRPNVRTFPVGLFIIFYSVTSAEIRVLRIIHASRDARALFADE